MRKLSILILMAALVLFLSGVGWAQSLGTAFTYQGKLSEGGAAANGIYDFQFVLFSTPDIMKAINIQAVEGVSVDRGVFTVELDFGSNAFVGERRWLEIGVRAGELADPNVYTPLGPRQELTAAPYFLYALTSGSVAGGTGVHGNGTDNYIPKFTGSSTISNSSIFESGGNVGIGTTAPQGKLDVNGAIYQRGGVLHADYVFGPKYQLESIEEHAGFMWVNRHFKAIPKAQVDQSGREIVEVGAQRKGIVEELEKAHIYIEQLQGFLSNVFLYSYIHLETGRGGVWLDIWA